MAEGISEANSVGFAENASMELVKELDLMKKKSEVSDGYQDHEAMTTIHFDKRISKLTVDHGREYCSKEQGAYYS